MIALSILTPAIPQRIAQVAYISAKLAGQIGSRDIEHLILMDNLKRTVGEKRQALLDAAHGKYIAFVDDDDDVADCYITQLMEALLQDPDVVTFDQAAEINGVVGWISFRRGNLNHKWRANQVSDRAVWHVCAWRRTLALRYSFPAKNYGEDWAWASPLQEWIQSEVHIPQILHFYRHSSETTAAPPSRDIAAE